MVADPGAEAPTVPQPTPGTAGQPGPAAQPSPGEEPTVPTVSPTPAAAPTAPMARTPAAPPPPAPTPVASPPAKSTPPEPEKWAARVIVPGATAPGQKKKAAPTTPTHLMARQDTAIEPRQARPAKAPSPAPARPVVRRRRSGFRRFVTALIGLVLVIAVPVVSAYVSYKLASGENPFEWPPTVDYDAFFP